MFVLYDDDRKNENAVHIDGGSAGAPMGNVDARKNWFRVWAKATSLFVFDWDPMDAHFHRTAHSATRYCPYLGLCMCRSAIGCSR